MNESLAKGLPGYTPPREHRDRGFCVGNVGAQNGSIFVALGIGNRVLVTPMQGNFAQLPLSTARELAEKLLQLVNEASEDSQP